MHIARFVRRSPGALCAAAGALAATAATHAQVTLTPLVIQGGPVPGLSASYSAQPTGNARVSAHGQFLVPAELSGPGITSGDNSSVELTGSASALGIAAMTGDMAFGAPAGFIVSIQSSNAAVTDSGSASVVVTITDPDTFDSTTAYWLATRGPSPTTPGTPLRMFGVGDNAPAPITGAMISSTLGLPSLSSAGRYFGFVSLSGSGITATTNQALLTGVPGQTPVVAVRQGDPAPGVPLGEPGGPGFIHIRDQSSLNINPTGQAIFRADLVNSTGSSLPFNHTALYGYDPTNGVTLIAREGASPGSGTLMFGAQMPSENISMNGSGAVAFQTQQGGAGSGIFVVWSGLPGSLAPVAQSNAQAPGLPTGVVYAATNGFSNTFDGLRIADSGAVAFSAMLTGAGVTSGNGQALFAGLPSSIQLVARLGDQAPGSPAGALFHSISNIEINAHGRVAFTAQDALAGFLPGLWAQDSSGTLRKIVRAGDTITVNGTPLTVSSVSPPAPGNGSDGLPCTYTADGRLVVQISFTDGSTSVFVASLGGLHSDYNGDGVVNVQDIFDFLSGWFAGNPRADTNGDGTISVQDIFDFLSDWFAGI